MIMNMIKRLFVCVAVIVAFGSASAFAQGGFRIVTNHPDFKIKVKRCEVSGSTCVIDMLLQNMGSFDVTVNVSGGWNNRSVAYDDEGNKYSGGRFKVQSGSSMSDTYTQMTLPSEVPVKLRIYIEGVPEAATEFTRIDLGVNCDAWHLGYGKEVRFSNMPISREGE